MKLRDIMTQSVIRIHPEESAAVAARTMEHYNIGMLPVCGSDGSLWGLLTDRDLVIRCMASGKTPDNTTVREIMTTQVICAKANMDIGVAAGLMGREQIRRLPVVENGKLCGMVSLGDLARRESSVYDAADALMEISSPVSARK